MSKSVTNFWARLYGTILLEKFEFLRFSYEDLHRPGPVWPNRVKPCTTLPSGVQFGAFDTAYVFRIVLILLTKH